MLRCNLGEEELCEKNETFLKHIIQAELHLILSASSCYLSEFRYSKYLPPQDQLKSHKPTDPLAILLCVADIGMVGGSLVTLTDTYQNKRHKNTIKSTSTAFTEI